ncbi:MAG: transcription antitermination factor NusB, partial [bacterium]
MSPAEETGAGRASGPSAGAQSGADPVRRAAHAALLEFARAPGAAEDLVARHAAGAFDARDRAFLRELVYGALRWRNRLDAAYGRFLREPPRRLSAPVREALRLGAYQLLFLDRVPAHGAVNTSVALAGGGGGGRRRARGLANAILRKVAEAGFGPPADPEERLVVWESHPRWLVRRWMAALGPERARLRCEANNREGPVVLRANPARMGAGELAERLAAEGATTVPGEVDPDCLRVIAGEGDARPAPLTGTLAFAQGAFTVQDESASLAARFAGVRPGARALDVCAAPGGKAAALAWAAGSSGLAVAADVSLPRLERLVGNCARIAPLVRILAMDARRPAFGEVFDAALVDAPCSGLGVLRRHPDARWRLRERDLERHGRRQREILAGAARVLRPGGRLVYAVCSNEPEETDEVAAEFAAPGFVRETGEAGRD